MNYFLGRSTQQSLWNLLGVYAVAVVVGIALGRFWPVLALASTALVAWHYRRLWRALCMLARRQRFRLPDGRGLWAELDTQLHKRQNEARQRRRRLLDMVRAYRRAFAALPDGIVILDADLQISWFNESATRLLGLRYPRDIGARFHNLVRNPRVLDWLDQRQTDEPLMDVPAPADERSRLSLRLIDYGNREWLVVARDVSKLMHLEQVRRDFVANVSHELRTPLTVIHGYLDMIEPEDMPEHVEMLREMRRQSSRMAQLVEDLLTLSRLEASTHASEETVALRPLLETLRREGEALSQGRHRISVEDACSADLIGSIKELHSAFSNLVSNAVRYTPQGGQITLRCELDRQGELAFRVRDTGPGMARQHLPRITERFYRISPSRSRENGGTGLGLAIVKHVLNLHDARLEIVSEVGRGSTFSCIFPSARVRPVATERVEREH